MLKRAGFVVAAAAAGLLATSPMAFADDGHGHGHDHDHGNHQHGVVNSQNNNLSAPIQACNNSVGEGSAGVLSKGQKNRDSHKGHCSLHNSVKN